MQTPHDGQGSDSIDGRRVRESNSDDRLSIGGGQTFGDSDDCTHTRTDERPRPSRPLSSHTPIINSRSGKRLAMAICRHWSFRPATVAMVAIMVAHLILLTLPGAVGARRSSKGNSGHWASRTAAAGLLKPERPRRPKHPNTNSTDGNQGHGPVPGIPVESLTGDPSTVPVNDLPIPKPDGQPRDPRYRAAKAAYKVRYG